MPAVCAATGHPGSGLVGYEVGDGQYLGRLGYEAGQLPGRGLARNVEYGVDRRGLRKQPGGKDNYEDDRRFAERLLGVVPGAEAAARANKNFLVRAVRFLLEEAGIGQVRCRDCGRSSRARPCGPRAEADTAMDPGLWCDVTKDPYLGWARA
jgi:S-adenosyl methyltransferase